MNDRKYTASKIRHRVILQEASVTEDDAGGLVRGWSDVAELWAEIVQMSGSESVVAAQYTQRNRYRVRLRYRADIDAQKRFLWNERVLSISSVDDTRQHEGVVDVVVLEEPESDA